MSEHKARQALRSHASATQAQVLLRFFKTGKGQYGEGDRFLGVMVPAIRKTARHFVSLSFSDVQKLLRSAYNEERLLALVILRLRYEKGTPAEQDSILKLYLSHLDHVNNWNLVDASAPYILGPSLYSRDRSLLDQLARSRNLWKRRIAVVSTFYFIRQNDFSSTLKLCTQLLQDPHDLMHKACGWMLREVGKRDESVLESFLKKHAHHMPRTMLRYAIERLPEKKRLGYLSLRKTW